MSDKPQRIFLSPPHMSGREPAFIQAAFDENYITTAGSNIPAFEAECCRLTGADYAVALNSGTAAIHLALRILGVGPGDEVLCSSFTFTATANPILYEKAMPVFIDSEADTWNMCPEALARAISDRRKKGKKPKAILLVHLYGMPARLREIKALADANDIPLIEDAAEALGSSYAGLPVGTTGVMGIYSFNGNKIITTSGGGLLVTSRQEFAEKAIFLAAQAKDPAPHYQHSQLGFNYRMSNILAGVGRGQLTVLHDWVRRRRETFAFYQAHLQDIPQISFQPELPESESNRWLSCLLLAPDSPVGPEALRLALEAENIESRPLWKPLHQQPLYAGFPFYQTGVADDLFNRGLCLPSGSALTQGEKERVAALIRAQFK